MRSARLRSSTAAIAAATIVASCSSSSETLPGAASTTTTATDAAVLEPETTDVGPTTPEPTQAATIADGVVIAAPVPTGDFGFGQHIVAFGDGFVRLQSGGGPTAVALSDAGQDWQPIESDLPAVSIQSAHSDGNRIVVTGFEGIDDRRGAAWLSVDGGTSWTTLPWPEPASPSGSVYLTTTLSPDSTAVTADRIVVAGTEFTMVDWRAYTMDVLHEDHGNPTGESFGGESMTVMFADGFELTVDPAALGFTPGAPQVNPVLLVHDGSTWTRADIGEPLQGGSFGAQVAAGPAGFVLIAPPVAFVSKDGATWTSHPLPREASTDSGAVIGGPLGYVAATSTALFHSLDGVEWTTVHQFEDLDDASTISPPATNPAAGGAGFVIPITDNLGTNPTLRVLTSPNGIAWTEQQRLDGAIGVDAAVSSNLILVVPFEQGDPADSMPPLPDDDEALAETLASAYDHQRTWISEQQAGCIGDGLIEEYGTERIRQLRILQYPFSLLGYGLSQMFERSDAEALVETYRHCAPDWEALLITTVTQGTEFISESSTRCVSTALDDDIAQEIFIVELDRPYDDSPTSAGPDLSHLEPLVTAMMDCLTDQEQNAIDFD